MPEVIIYDVDDEEFEDITTWLEEQGENAEDWLPEYDETEEDEREANISS